MQATTLTTTKLWTARVGNVGSFLIAADDFTSALDVAKRWRENAATEFQSPHILDARINVKQSSDGRPLYIDVRNTVPTLHEVEDGEGNGIVHWYCSTECREQESADYGDIEKIDVPTGEVPEGTICETCGRTLA